MKDFLKVFAFSFTISLFIVTMITFLGCTRQDVNMIVYGNTVPTDTTEKESDSTDANIEDRTDNDRESRDHLHARDENHNRRYYRKPKNDRCEDRYR